MKTPSMYARPRGEKKVKPSPALVGTDSDSSEPLRPTKRRRRPESGRVSTEEPATPAKRPWRQRHAPTSDEGSSEKQPQTPDNIQLPDGPNEMDLLRWDLVKIIHNKPNAASLEAPTLMRLLGVLQQDHPSYSEDELQEKAEFSVMIQERWDGPTKDGKLSNSDLRALEFILKVPFMDRSAVDAHERDICLGIFTPSMSGDRQRPMKSWSPAGLRLLHRVLRKSQLDPRDKQVLIELNTALETDVPMSRATWQNCMNILFRDSVAKQAGRSTRSQICRSEHVSQVQMPERIVQATRLSAPKPKHPTVTPRPTSDSLSDPESTIRTEPTAALPDPRPKFQLSKSLADSLFEVYCHTDYPLLPIIDLFVFETYQDPPNTHRVALKSSQAGPLKFCHAIACLSNGDPRVLKHAPALYQSAQESMASIMNSGDMLSLVQCQVLQSQYLRAIGDLTSAWEVIGLAIRKAYTLGIKAKLDKKFDPHSTSNKLAVRLWQSMQMMERSLALDLGVTYCGIDSIFNKALSSDTWADGVPGMAENDQGTSTCISKFFYASYSLHAIMDELVDFEEELRLSNGQCALQKIKEADLRDFMNIEAKLASWYESLPTVLQDPTALRDGILSDSPNPSVVRLRNRLLMRYLYFKIRLYRPLLILGVALSISCVCGSGPHMRRENRYGKHGLSILTIIRNASSKCLNLAAQLTDLLWQYKGSASLPIDTSACEYAHYAYACGLALIAARGLRFISTDSKDKEVRVYHAGQFDKILRLLEIGEKNMEDNKDLSHLFCICQQALRDVSKLAGEPNKSALTSEYVDFDKLSWHKLYARNRVDPPIPPHPRLPDISRLLGWFESLPVDLMG
ncbi:hypothetical protein N7451_004100 [Penicillium sp. IBT 35674x]|nr:hypothetical protein N7451_004100 [Penicillium sp. IBT 35674x]